MLTFKSEFRNNLSTNRHFGSDVQMFMLDVSRICVYNARAFFLILVALDLNAVSPMTSVGLVWSHILIFLKARKIIITSHAKTSTDNNFRN